MDKYEYRLKLDEMKSLAGEGNYEKAEEIADTINWKKVKNVNSLVLASEIYSHVERYEDSRDVLLMAYDRSPIGRMIIYRLAELAIHTHSFDEAKDYYEEFVEIAPHDNLKYVLRYKLSKEQGEDITEQIKILEELKEQEYTEKWAYELAHLYHEAGMSDKCIDACDELVLWFGDGIYVEKALELKMLYQPLTPKQEEKYLTFRREQSEREGIVKVYQDEDLASGEIVAETVQIPKVTTNTGRFNTVNLQEELAKSMQQIMDATEKETVSDTMDNIKKMVEDIPYLQMPQEEKKEPEKYGHIETDEEIDGSLKINFKELLGEDKDGQMSLNVPEQAMIERQITGQMSISDVLEEWEKTKRAAETALQEAEQRRLESAKARALQETEEIMERLKDVVPQLENDLTSKEELENEYQKQENGGEAAGKIVANMNQILQKEIDKLSRSTEDLDEILKQKKEETKESREQRLAKKMVQPTKRIPSLEAFMKRTFFQDDDLILEDEQEEEEYDEEPVVEDLNVADVAEETEAPVTEPEALDEEVEEVADVQENLPEEEYTEDDGEYDEDNESAEDEYDDEELEYVDEEEYEEEYDEDGEYDDEELEYADEEEYEDEYDEDGEYDDEELEYADEEEYEDEYDEDGEYDEEELEYVDEEEYEDEYDEDGEYDDEEIEYADEEEYEEEYDEDGEYDEEEYREDEVKYAREDAPSGLSEDEKELFSYFMPVNGMEQQISQAIFGASKHLNENAGFGHIMIQGIHGSGKTVLATSLVKALQKQTGRPNGRIGKIEGKSLNQKDIAMLFRKIAGGCLIIENAGDISRETAVRLALCLETDESDILVILEDTREGLKKALGRDEKFAERFTEKITIPIFTSDELVAFAKAYANELGYDIDEMATLALYNRISNIQRLDEPTNLVEVKEIVDEAIARAEKGGLKKVFSILTSRRYTEDDYIALREKDFDE